MCLEYNFYSLGDEKGKGLIVKPASSRFIFVCVNLVIQGAEKNRTEQLHQYKQVING